MGLLDDEVEFIRASVDHGSALSQGFNDGTGTDDDTSNPIPVEQRLVYYGSDHQVKKYDTEQLRQSMKVISDKIKKILIPFDTSKDRKKELIREGFIVETFFNNDNEIKKIAFEKKIEFCLINNKVISII